MVDAANQYYSDNEYRIFKEIEEGGGTIVILSDDEYAAWVEGASSIVADLEDSIGERLINAMRRVKDPCPKPKESQCPTPSGHEAPE